MNYFLTGGTGSFGQQITQFLLEKNLATKIIIFSRDEYKQFYMRMRFPDERVEFVVGDVRDLSTIKKYLKDIDVVIHAAALKQIPTIEDNPFEAVKTNILGTENIITACIEANVSRAVFISTDKAVEPINFYGATKLCAEKLFIDANKFNKTKFGAVRYGNVIGSRGSIVEKYKGKSLDSVDITHPGMTRFWVTLQQSCQLVMFAVKNIKGGEVIVPKAASMTITDMLDVLQPKAKQVVTGMRPGEKLHEILLGPHEIERTYVFQEFYIVLPERNFKHIDYEFYKTCGYKLDKDFRFVSNNNERWFTKDQLKRIVYEK